MKTKSFLLGIATTIITLTTIFFITYKYSEKEQNEYLKSEMSKNAQNIDFTLVRLNKSEIENFKNSFFNKPNISEDKIVFLNLWATWCAPCIKELPHLVKLAKLNPKIDFIFSTNEDNEKMVSFVKKKNYIQKHFNSHNEKKMNGIISSNSLPTTYIINFKKGIAYKIEGVQNWNSELFSNFLNSL